jgi:hypothetical protein
MVPTFSEQDVQKTLMQHAMRVCDHSLLLYSYRLTPRHATSWLHILADAYDNSMIVLNSADRNFAPQEIDDLLIFPVRSPKYSVEKRMEFFGHLAKELMPLTRSDWSADDALEAVDKVVSCFAVGLSFGRMWPDVVDGVLRAAEGPT